MSERCGAPVKGGAIPEVALRSLYFDYEDEPEPMFLTTMADVQKAKLHLELDNLRLMHNKVLEENRQLRKTVERFQDLQEEFHLELGNLRHRLRTSEHALKTMQGQVQKAHVDASLSESGTRTPSSTRSASPSPLTSPCCDGRLSLMEDSAELRRLQMEHQLTRSKDLQMLRELRDAVEKEVRERTELQKVQEQTEAALHDAHQAKESFSQELAKANAEVKEWRHRLQQSEAEQKQTLKELNIARAAAKRTESRVEKKIIHKLLVQCHPDRNKDPEAPAATRLLLGLLGEAEPCSVGAPEAEAWAFDFEPVHQEMAEF